MTVSLDEKSDVNMSKLKSINIDFSPMVAMITLIIAAKNATNLNCQRNVHTKYELDTLLKQAVYKPFDSYLIAWF